MRRGSNTVAPRQADSEATVAIESAASLHAIVHRWRSGKEIAHDEGNFSAAGNVGRRRRATVVAICLIIVAIHLVGPRGNSVATNPAQGAQTSSAEGRRASETRRRCRSAAKERSFRHFDRRDRHRSSLLSCRLAGPSGRRRPLHPKEHQRPDQEGRKADRDRCARSGRRGEGQGGRGPAARRGKSNSPRSNGKLPWPRRKSPTRPSGSAKPTNGPPKRPRIIASSG